MGREALPRALPGLLLAARLLGGCAQTRQVMRADPELRAGDALPVWPAAPETPRYRYVGQLLGEDNFVPENGNAGGAGLKLLQWLVGLGQGKENKITLKRSQSGAVDAQGRVYVQGNRIKTKSVDRALRPSSGR